LRGALRSNNKALPGINGDDSWELPVPATYVFGRDGRVALAAIDAGYRDRLEPFAIVTTPRSLRQKLTPQSKEAHSRELAAGVG
jgi:hypothetical protein